MCMHRRCSSRRGRAGGLSGLQRSGAPPCRCHVRAASASDCTAVQHRHGSHVRDTQHAAALGGLHAHHGVPARGPGQQCMPQGHAPNLRGGGGSRWLCSAGAGPAAARHACRARRHRKPPTHAHLPTPQQPQHTDTGGDEAAAMRYTTAPTHPSAAQAERCTHLRNAARMPNTSGMCGAALIAM